MFAKAPICEGEIVVIWDYPEPGPDPADPSHYMNHSCDPNVWMISDVAMTARRDIPSGEELLVDYILFEEDEEFVMPWTCRCNTAVCRKTLGGLDWRKKELRDRYAGHFLPAIQRRIEEAKLLCSREGIEVDFQEPRCPLPTSQCQYRELCPVKDAEREREKEG